jgi:glycosyltransferase involved in cell wall biosynthesis
MNEEKSLPHLYRELHKVLLQIGKPYEIIFVDDGSTDGSVDVVKALRAQDPGIKLLSFSRNFGHQAALTAGMDFAAGDMVAFMDADLQHPPALLLEMMQKWEEGYEVVYTLREATEGAGAAKDLSSRLFYHLFRRLTGIKLESNSADFRLLDRKVVNIFKNEIRERTRFLRGLTAWVGFRSVGIPYRAAGRVAGASKYNLRRMFLLAVDGISSFSVAPLYFGVVVGGAVSLLGFAYGAYAFIAHFVQGLTIPGWSSIAVLVAVLGGIQLTLMGIIGIYIGKIYDEVKHRPLYLVRQAQGFDKQS